MTGADIKDLFDRLGRLVAVTAQRAGGGTTWDYTFPDGKTHRYVISGLKSHAEAEDSAFNLLIWIWSSKNYLKRRAKALGKNPRMVEQDFNSDPHLSICKKLANDLKHGGLTQSRSQKHPRLGKLMFKVPLEALSSLTFQAFEVQAEIANPDAVEFYLPIVDQAGKEIGDVFDYAARGLAALEKLRDKIENKI